MDKRELLKLLLPRIAYDLYRFLAKQECNPTGT